MPDWGEILNEIQKKRSEGDRGAYDTVRRKYLAQLHQHTGRNIIAYYSGFLTKPHIVGVDITDEDKHGFMSCIHKLDSGKGFD